MLPYARLRFQQLDQERALDARSTEIAQKKIQLHAETVALMKFQIAECASLNAHIGVGAGAVNLAKRPRMLVLAPATSPPQQQQPMTTTPAQAAQPTTDPLADTAQSEQQAPVEPAPVPLFDNNVVNVFSAAGQPVCSARLGNTSNYASFTSELKSELADMVDWAKFWRISCSDTTARNTFLMKEIQRVRRKRKDHVFVDEKVRARYKTTPISITTSDPLGGAIVALFGARREHAALRLEKAALLASYSHLEAAAMAEMEDNHWKSVPVKHTVAGQRYTMTRHEEHSCVRVTVARLTTWVADVVGSCAHEGDTADLLARLFHLVQTRERAPAAASMCIVPEKAADALAD